MVRAVRTGALKSPGGVVDRYNMNRSRGALTPYLASALRLGGPGCERAFLAREEKALLRGAPLEDVKAIRNLRSQDGDDPGPRPIVLRLRRKAA